MQGLEVQRLADDAARKADWKRFGPYLSERQWATVREDYSSDGSAWTSFPFDHARSRAYRWGEDGLLGFTDRQCRLCFALAMWNGRDPILKERLFGLTNLEGNHGEDVKECYAYLDSAPTHSWFRGLYKYPQARFPYEQLRDENRRRSKREPEFKLADTGIFAEDRYFDITAEYAKASPDDLLIEITAANRGPGAARLDLLPTFWYRNTWTWGCLHEGCWAKPSIRLEGDGTLRASHVSLGEFRFAADKASDGTPPRWLLTENETNRWRLYGQPNERPWVKDAFHDFLIEGNTQAVSSQGFGTKAAAWYSLTVPAGGTVSLRLRLAQQSEWKANPFGGTFPETFALRKAEAEEFFAQVIPPELPLEERQIARQAAAGMLWSKQFYHYIVEDWLHGDPNSPPPPDERRAGRNADWPHLFSRDLLSVPDKWEYPWFASWDLAFQMLPFARLDPHFAREQLKLLLREWYLHPNGQLPAYEYDFSNAAPPVHAWACRKIYDLAADRRGDTEFLSSVFLKLLLNFTWWVNRKDTRGRHLFSGGFLGLDNIGVFDRSAPLPGGESLEQADGTAWMAFYCGTMLSMALELAKSDPGAEDIASKFFEHYIHIADAINRFGGSGLWDEEDGFYYDHIRVAGSAMPLKVRSIAGLIPLLAAEILDEDLIMGLPGFRKRFQWFLANRGDLAQQITYLVRCSGGRCSRQRMLAIPSLERLKRILRCLLDENEFLSPFGIRSLSKYHECNPFVLRCGGREMSVAYAPGESDSDLFGGNSNWRGPIWFPLNYLLIEALRRYDTFYGDTLLVELPTGSGRMATLGEVADELKARLVRLFLCDTHGRRPCLGNLPPALTHAGGEPLVMFHEYFHAETGLGLGASHQTGWTGLILNLLCEAPFCRV